MVLIEGDEEEQDKGGPSEGSEGEEEPKGGSWDLVYSAMHAA